MACKAAAVQCLFALLAIPHASRGDTSGSCANASFNASQPLKQPHVQMHLSMHLNPRKPLYTGDPRITCRSSHGEPSALRRTEDSQHDLGIGDHRRMDPCRSRIREDFPCSESTPAPPAGLLAFWRLAS